MLQQGWYNCPLQVGGRNEKKLHPRSSKGAFVKFFFFYYGLISHSFNKLNLKMCLNFLLTDRQQPYNCPGTNVYTAISKVDTKHQIYWSTCKILNEILTSLNKFLLVFIKKNFTATFYRIERQWISLLLSLSKAATSWHGLRL